MTEEELLDRIAQLEILFWEQWYAGHDEHCGNLPPGKACDAKPFCNWPVPDGAGAPPWKRFSGEVTFHTIDRVVQQTDCAYYNDGKKVSGIQCPTVWADVSGKRHSCSVVYLHTRILHQCDCGAEAQ